MGETSWGTASFVPRLYTASKLSLLSSLKRPLEHSDLLVGLGTRLLVIGGGDTGNNLTDYFTVRLLRDVPTCRLEGYAPLFHVLVPRTAESTVPYQHMTPTALVHKMRTRGLHSWNADRPFLEDLRNKLGTGPNH